MAVTNERRRRAHVVLPEGLIDEVDERVGQRGRSRFIQEAVEEKLNQLRRVKAFERVVGSSKEGAIPEWETKESTSDWVRELRREWDSRTDLDPTATA